MGKVKYDFIKGEYIGDNQRRSELFFELTTISKKYIAFETNISYEQRIVCKCGTDVTELSARNKEKIKCSNCNATIMINSKVSSIKTKNNDSPITQMEKSIRDFQGKKINAVPQSIINTLKNFYEEMAKKERNRGDSSTWSCQNLIVDNPFDLSPSERYKTGRDHKALYDALSKTGLSKVVRSL